MKLALRTILAFVILLVSCGKKVATETKASENYFRQVHPDSSGINFSNDLYYSDELNIIEYLYYYNGGGVAVGDINNDGLEDLYFTANQKPDRLYLNQGNLRFKDITEEAGLQIDSTWSTGVTMEDINNDGLLDIYVSKVGKYKSLNSHNLLYINNGDLTFTEKSEDYGLNFSGLSTQASFFDYDNDGDMDVYLMNHSVHTPRSYGNIEQRSQNDSLSGDRLYENLLDEGKETFKDVTQISGIYSSALGYGLALITSDVNSDGLVDIYVGNDFHENDYLYLNQGDKTFKESSTDFLDHTTRFTMGVDIADMNGDQLFDIFTLDMMPFDHEIFMKSGGEDSDKVRKIKENFGYGEQYARNTFQLNQNNNYFTDIALQTETHATDWSWSVLLQDYDNDGLNDIYVTNGIYKRPNDLDYINYLSNTDFAQFNLNQQKETQKKLIDEMPTVKLSNVLFKNQGDLSFERISSSSDSGPSYSNGAAYADLDNDGDLDLVVNNIDQKAFVLENTTKKENHFISLEIKGDEKFRNTTGTKVFVYTEDMSFVKELTVTKGFQSSSTRRLHFGLGEIQKIDSIKIKWLDGYEQVEKDIAIDQFQTLTRTDNLKPSKASVKKEVEPLTTFPFIHLENSFLDYEREPLMPEKLSSEGPAVVEADFNGDGLTDLFIGGARYQSSQLFLQQKNGEFINSVNSNLGKDLIYEDVSAAAFDLENDGDLDLYVMSGGNDKFEEDIQLEDRIYVNDGNANFTRLKTNLIRTNGGSVSSSDFNGDGYDDLFIGNRSIPGGYGLSPFSYMLTNNGKGEFMMAQKGRLGMVTDSKWADINNDDLLDLIIVGDWMPITILLNQGNSSFLNKTIDFGLENTQGMWNTVLADDFDGDGRVDIMAGNAGLNFKWKASVEKPVKLYLDDFDDNEQPDPIIYYNFFGEYVPYASKDKLTGQLPSLKKKLLSYTDFSKTGNIEDLTGKKESEILEIKKISELRSMVYWNKEGGFKATALPQEAQMSSIEDFYKNDNTIYYVGNYLGYANELGQSTANSGGVLTINNGELKSSGNLPIPKGLNSRRIVRLNGNEYLVISNNDKAYIVEPD
ncbi:VCBS repeat-containing protein [Pseudozobellia sp. WGM2]|uniref:VCBS repeat-containing protein n=1 Tax=Pseudozobellia sp. WGM2 TaxID=2787625 RepID=UPI001ADF2944|nr:VCBS repeat-containing protein [Pseudozobellia sp. WGM2]